MPSFDIKLEPDTVEVRNAVDQTTREIGTRFDFKGTAAAIELNEQTITLHGDADFQLQQIMDVLRNKLTKRQVDVRFLDPGSVEKAGGDKVKQAVRVRSGIPTEIGKKIQQDRRAVMRGAALALASGLVAAPREVRREECCSCRACVVFVA